MFKKKKEEGKLKLLQSQFLIFVCFHVIKKDCSAISKDTATLLTSHWLRSVVGNAVLKSGPEKN